MRKKAVLISFLPLAVIALEGAPRLPLCLT